MAISYVDALHAPFDADLACEAAARQCMATLFVESIRAQEAIRQVGSDLRIAAVGETFTLTLASAPTVSVSFARERGQITRTVKGATRVVMLAKPEVHTWTPGLELAAEEKTGIETQISEVVRLLGRAATHRRGTPP